MHYDTIIFDLDGTLSDSKKGIFESLRYALNKINQPIPDDSTLDLFLGPPLVYSFSTFSKLRDEKLEFAIKHYKESYENEHWSNNYLYKGMFELIINLHKNGYKLAIATGKPQKEAEKIIKFFKLDKYFDIILGFQHNEKLFNKSDLIKKIIQPNEKAIMIGDRKYDIEAAIASNVDSALVLYGYCPQDEIESLNPTYRIAEIDDFYKLFNIPKTMLSGFFISLEGNDGTGKTTQSKLLFERLKKLGLDCIATREPGGCPISEKIRKLLLDNENANMHKITEALLFAAARAQHVHEVIKPNLEQNKIVISERFVDSSLAYQGGGHGLGEEFVLEINKPAIDNCLPNITVFLKVDYKTGLDRREKETGKDRIEVYADDFHSKTQRSFEKLEKLYSNRYYPIICDTSVEEIHERVVSGVVDKYVKEVLN